MSRAPSVQRLSSTSRAGAATAKRVSSRAGGSSRPCRANGIAPLGRFFDSAGSKNRPIHLFQRIIFMLRRQLRGALPRPADALAQTVRSLCRIGRRLGRNSRRTCFRTDSRSDSLASISTPYRHMKNASSTCMDERSEHGLPFRLAGNKARRPRFATPIQSFSPQGRRRRASLAETGRMRWRS